MQKTISLPKCLYRPDDGEKFLLDKDTYYMERSYMQPPYRYSYEKLMECGFLTLEAFVQRRRLAEGPDPRNGAVSENPQILIDLEKGKLVASIAAQIVCANLTSNENARIKIDDVVNAAKELVRQSFTEDGKTNENPS